MESLTYQSIAFEVAFIVSVELDSRLVVVGTFSDHAVLAENIVNLLLGGIKWQRRDIDSCVLALLARFVGFLLLCFALNCLAASSWKRKLPDLCFSIGLTFAEIDCWFAFIYSLNSVNFALLRDLSFIRLIVTS